MYDKPRYRRLQMKSRQKLFSDTSPELQMMHDNEEGEQKKSFKDFFFNIAEKGNLCCENFVAMYANEKDHICNAFFLSMRKT